MESALTGKIIKDYLELKLKKKVEILEFNFIGEGYYANGYKAVYKIGDEIKKDFIRVIKPLNSGHDYPIDRALQLVTTKEISDRVPKTPGVYDVVGFDRKGNIASIAANVEYFSIGEYIENATEYTADLQNIAKRKNINNRDISRCLELSDYLVGVHKEKFIAPGEKNSEKINLAKSLYKRALREIISNGELTLGILDFDWRKEDWVSKKEIYDFIAETLLFRENIKNKYWRLGRVHGDFWDKNILFKNGKMIASDPSRFIWGEPAIDVAALIARFMNFGLVNSGGLGGVFGKLAKIFIKNYLEKTDDAEILVILPYAFSFEALVSSHPTFHPELSVDLRRTWIKISKKIIEGGKFDWENLNKYLN